MAYSPDSFDDEELTQMAMDILVDIKQKATPELVDTPSSTLESNTFDLYIPLNNANKYNNDEELRTKSMQSTLQTSIDPNTLHAAYPKPKLSILSSNQFSASDSFNIPLPDIPTKHSSIESLQSAKRKPMILSNVSSTDSFNMSLPPIPTRKHKTRKVKKLTHRSMHTPPPNHKQHTFKYPTLFDVPSTNLTISPRITTNVRRQSTIPNFVLDDEFATKEKKKRIKMQPLKHKGKSMNKMNEYKTSPPHLYGKHSSIYIDFDRDHDRKKKRKRKPKKKRSASPSSLRKYKQRLPSRGMSCNSQVESVNDYKIQFLDRHSSTR